MPGFRAVNKERVEAGPMKSPFCWSRLFGGFYFGLAALLVEAQG
jgi:hypothetical protein